MSQLSFLRLGDHTWSVADLTRYLRQMLEGDYRLQDVWVTGEVSNLSRPASGHIYFTIKDAEASLKCVMWKTDALRHPGLPREGEALEVHGHIGLYEIAGQYQLYADRMRPAGEGQLFQAFLRLKAQLESEGLFRPDRKRPLPDWPQRIGIVTSPAAAALRDVVHVLRRRFPLAEVVLAPTAVQGDEAPQGIVSALASLNRHVRPDVILLVRGGGSLEDLAAFNDETVARAVAASEAPVVSGVGHETDFTIVDFVADLRAPTPSAAAEIATPDRFELTEAIAGLRRRQGRALGQALMEARGDIAALRSTLRTLSPRAVVANARQRLDDLHGRGLRAMRARLRLRREATAGLRQTLRAVGPEAVLARGYAIVRLADSGAVVKSTRQAKSGDRLEIRVHDGSFPATTGEK
ncbi:MAG TPA: exodeoxyribonuclease VII large subunit [Anaerolineales bacterium]|nr:exodeoxyribonuclease VII large subunit [Anaerolineales bacterium]